MTDKQEDIREFLHNLPDKYDILEESINIQTQKLAAKDLDSIVESVDLSDTFIGLTVLVPMNVAVGTLIETGIKKCNDLGDSVFAHYYVTNQVIPDKLEINNIIKIIRG